MTTRPAPSVEALTSGGAGARWSSFHLHGQPPFDEFLVDALLPWIEEATAAGRVRRFFFIRYSEGGPHLRLRFIAAREAQLADELRHIARGGRWRLEAHRYDRREHYFGETRATVYAELLNESTSWLSLRLLHSLGSTAPRGTRWAVTAATLYSLVGRAAPEPGRAEMVDESVDFAREAALALRFPVSVPPRAAMDVTSASLRLLLPRVEAALQHDDDAGHAVRLLRRTARGGAAERFAGTHGLHLLCNKMGFSLREELEMFTLLRALAEAPGIVPPAGEAP